MPFYYKNLSIAVNKPVSRIGFIFFIFFRSDCRYFYRRPMCLIFFPQQLNFDASQWNKFIHFSFLSSADYTLLIVFAYVFRT